MATFGIESNGRLEKTAIYFNGEQLGGIKEIFLNLDEDGTFDAVIAYEGTDKILYTKKIFEEYLDNIKITEPSFTEEEAAELHLLVVESNGDIENTTVLFDEEVVDGIVSLFLHIKSVQNKTGIHSLFSSKREISEGVEFKADFTFRYDDNRIETEAIF